MSTTKPMTEERLAEFERRFSQAKLSRMMFFPLQDNEILDLLHEIWRLRNEVKRLQQMQPRY